MKKSTAGVALILAAAVFLSGSALTANAKSAMKVHMELAVLYNARKIQSDVKPQNANGQIRVELKSVLTSLKAKYNLKGKDITISKGSRTVKLTIGASTATVNGKTVTLGLPAASEQGRTLVPLRFVSEALGEKVEWDPINQYVWIGNKDIPKLEDAVQPVDIGPYLKYFGGKQGELVIDDGFSPKKTKVRIMKEVDFPVIIAGDIYYRMDYAVKIEDGKEYTRAVTSDKGVMGRTFYLLQMGQPLKLRSEIMYIRESIGNIRIHYNSIVASTDEINLGINDYEKLKLKDVDYVGIYAPSDAAILIENYLVKKGKKEL